MKKVYCLVLHLFFVLQYSHSADLKPGFVKKVIAERLDPTSLAIAPDGRVFVLEKKGLVRVIQNDQLLDIPFISIDVDNFNERGLGGIVLDPDFESNGFVYIYYTVKNSHFNRVSRFIASGNTAVPGSELVLLDLDYMPSGVHNGGAMAFGADGNLYIATGDGGDPSLSQRHNSLLGKVLRITSTGSIPDDNPFFDTLDGKNRSIWAYGFRNPFSMSFDPVNNKILLNDVGGEHYEEVNEVEKGKNYGWPIIEGPLGNRVPPTDYKEPLFYYDHSKGCSIVGAAFYNPEQLTFPPHFVTKYFFADYCSGNISVFDPGVGVPVDTLALGLDRPVALAVSSQGSLYYLQRSGIRDGSISDNTSTADGSLWKISFSGNGEPFIARNPNEVIIPINEIARFEVIAYGELPLTYTWFINDMVLDDNDSPVLELKDIPLDAFDSLPYIKCVVSNAHGMVETEPARLIVTNNTRPVPQILTPHENFKYTGGAKIAFSGMAYDLEDGLLDARQLTWEIVFHHDDHTHPAMTPVTGISKGSYTIPKVGETSTNVWYRLYLTAIDSDGLAQKIYKDFYPEIASVTVRSKPENIPLSVDGKLVEPPYQFDAVVGTTRTLEATAGIKQLGKDIFLFKNWGSNHENRIFSFDVPASSGSYTTNYEQIKLGAGKGLQGSYYNSYKDFVEDLPVLQRIDSLINFDWDTASPGPEVMVDNFFGRWNGFVQPYISGDYTFTVSADDGVNLWVDNKLVINDWTNHPFTTFEGTVYLKAPALYPIKLEYYDKTGGAAVRLAWKSNSFQTEVIPQHQLISPMDFILSDNLLPLDEENLYDRTIVFPNPFTNELRMVLSKHRGVISAKLQDVQGRQVLKEQQLSTFNSTSRVILPEHIGPGVYFLTLSSSQKNEVIRLVKLNKD